LWHVKEITVLFCDWLCVYWT